MDAQDLSKTLRGMEESVFSYQAGCIFQALSPHSFLFLILLDPTRNSNSGDTDVQKAQSYSHQDPSAGFPAKGLEGGSSSSGCLDYSVDRDQGSAPPGPGQGCCKTWLEIQREECFLRPALAHMAWQKDLPSLSIKPLYARDKKPS